MHTFEQWFSQFTRIIRKKNNYIMDNKQLMLIYINKSLEEIDMPVILL